MSARLGRAVAVAVAALVVAPATTTAQGPPASTPRSLESMPPPSRPWRQTLSVSPLHLAASMIEVTAEVAVPPVPRLAIAAMLGVRAADDAPDSRAFGMSFGASVAWYVFGTFTTGVAVGLEGQISSLDRQDVTGTVAPLVVGDGAEASLWVGGKWAAPIGATVTAQLGVAWRRDLDTHQGDTVGPDRVRPVLNLLAGWTL